MNIEIGVVGIHFVREHTTEFEFRKLFIEAIYLRLNVRYASFIVFFNGHIEELTTIAHTYIKIINSFNNIFEAGALTAESLRAFGIFPNIGFAKFKLNFR